VSSQRPFDLLDLEAATPTTARDLAALRRKHSTGENWLERIEALAFPDLFGTRPRRRPVPAGREPFRLDDPTGDG